MEMILQTPLNTKEPYRLQTPRSDSAQPTEQQPKDEVSPTCHGTTPNNEVYPGPYWRRHFRGKTRFTPVFSTTSKHPTTQLSIPPMPKGMGFLDFFYESEKRGLSRSSLFRF